LKEDGVDADTISGNIGLNRDSSVNVWRLNAGISVSQNATLYINSTDTSWLKIIADGETAHPIIVSGSLKIDSIKVTSWDPNTESYAMSQDSDRNGQDDPYEDQYTVPVTMTIMATGMRMIPAIMLALAIYLFGWNYIWTLIKPITRWHYITSSK
jgi:hypothetical protein